MILFCAHFAKWSSVECSFFKMYQWLYRKSIFVQCARWQEWKVKTPFLECQTCYSDLGRRRALIAVQIKSKLLKMNRVQASELRFYEKTVQYAGAKNSWVRRTLTSPINQNLALFQSVCGWKNTISLNKLEELYRKFVGGSYKWGPYRWNNSAQRYERAILSTAPDQHLNSICSMLSFWNMSRLLSSNKN